MHPPQKTTHQDRLARLLQRVPPSALGGLDSATDTDDDDEEEEEKEKEGKEAAAVAPLSLASAVLPSIQRHGLTRAELVLRVSRKTWGKEPI